MIKKLLSTTVLFSGLVFAQASFATTFDFAKYADDVYGEQGYAWGEFSHTEGNVTVYAEGAANFDPVQWVNDVNYLPKEAYAYLDEGDAGLGVCKKLNKKDQCSPSSDDNVSYGEALGLWFTDANDNLMEVTINELMFKNALHTGTFGTNETFWVMVDGVSNQYSLTSAFTTALTGSEFIFWTGEQGTEFYISSIDVPAPAPLALLALGLMGIYSVTRKKQITV